MHYSTRYIDVAHRVTWHCATCRATLQLQLWNLSYCIQLMSNPPDNGFQLETCTISRDISMSRNVSRDRSRDVAATILKHVLLYSAYAKTSKILISARSVQYSPSCSDVAHEVAQHCATCCATLQLQLWNIAYFVPRMRLPKYARLPALYLHCTRRYFQLSSFFSEKKGNGEEEGEIT